MIRRADFEEVGYLKKLVGTDGAFLLKLKQTNNWFITEKKPIFIELDGNLVPFFMDNIKQDKSEPIIHFDNILSREKAVSFLDKTCFYPKKLLVNTEITPTLENLAGYTLVDKASSLELIITNINLIPGNPLLEVIYKEKSFDIPFLNDAVKSFDAEKQIIHSNYPEGLLQSLLDMV